MSAIPGTYLGHRVCFDSVCNHMVFLEIPALPSYF
jgi:hypothetical protein